MRVLATLHRFLREGTPWRSLRASEDQASGSTLRRTLARRAEQDVLSRAHRLMVGLLRRPGPDLVVDSSSVQATRGGELTGPNPADRGKRGAQCHVAVTRDGIPVACAATGARVSDTVLFDCLFRAALCRRPGTRPRVGRRETKHGSGLGKTRWPVERTNAWLLQSKRLGLRYDRKGRIVTALLHTACLLLGAPRPTREL